MKLFNLTFFLLLMSLSLQAQSDEIPSIPPIAWEIQRYNGYPPRQLWLSIDGQPGEVIYARGIHDAFFSPDRQTIAFVAQDLLGNNYLQGNLILEAINPFGYGDRGLSADIFGDVPDTLHHDDISFIGVQWIDNERLLFNSIYTTTGNFYRPNRMDLHTLDIYQQHQVIYEVGEGGWAFPDPTGQVIALFSEDSFRLLSSDTFEEIGEPLIFGSIVGSDFQGSSYPLINWSVDGTQLLFHVRNNNNERSCLLQLSEQTLNCELGLPIVTSGYSPDLSRVAYVEDNQLIVGTIDLQSGVEIIAQHSLQSENSAIPVLWIADATVLYRVVDGYCSERVQGAPSSYFVYTLDTDEITAWLPEYDIIALQQLDDNLFAVATGDCQTITIQLYDSESDQMTIISELSHPNPMYWFRFIP